FFLDDFKEGFGCPAGALLEDPFELDGWLDFEFTLFAASLTTAP
ncbi:hypothetical protein Tco_1342210, partial [Tanacetum coccineum]